MSAATMKKQTGKLGPLAAIAAFLTSTSIAALAGTLCYWWLSEPFELRRLMFWADDFGSRRMIQTLAVAVAGFVLSRFAFGYFLDEKPGGTAKHTIGGLALAILVLAAVDITSPETLPALVRTVLDVYDKILG